LATGALTSGTFYRRSPFLLAWWSGKNLVLFNYATRAAFPVTPDVLAFLGTLSQWRSERTLLAEAAPRSQGVRRTLRRLARLSLLESRTGGHSPPNPMSSWGPWNPFAGAFHMATKDAIFVNSYQRDATASRRSRPRPAKAYPHRPVIALTDSERTDPFVDVLLRRRTWRQFGAGPLTLSDLSTLLSLTSRIQMWGLDVDGNRAPFKTSPSGGAMHAGEAYVIVLKVTGLRNGIYHYRADRHALERLQGDATPALVRRFLPAQPWFAKAAAVVLFTAVFGRSQWHYPYGRSYRAVLIEAGHLCQTFLLTATWLGLAPFCTMTLADTPIERALGLDGVTESVLYAAGVGQRPAGLMWAPNPPLSPELRSAMRRRLKETTRLGLLDTQELSAQPVEALSDEPGKPTLAKDRRRQARLER
jgi:SagB-type dehydrogenase family enzyme